MKENWHKRKYKVGKEKESFVSLEVLKQKIKIAKQLSLNDEIDITVHLYTMYTTHEIH